VEIVVPLEKNDFRTALDEVPELLKYREIMGERDPAVPDPEFEQIAEDIEGLRVPLQSCKKSEQHPVVIVLWVPQVGISYENLSHDGTIAENLNEVKIEVERK
jgi:hypothetical protein